MTNASALASYASTPPRVSSVLASARLSASAQKDARNGSAHSGRAVRGAAGAGADVGGESQRGRYYGLNAAQVVVEEKDRLKRRKSNASMAPAVSSRPGVRWGAGQEGRARGEGAGTVQSSGAGAPGGKNVSAGGADNFFKALFAGVARGSLFADSHGKSKNVTRGSGAGGKRSEGDSGHKKLKEGRKSKEGTNGEGEGDGEGKGADGTSALPPSAATHHTSTAVTSDKSAKGASPSDVAWVQETGAPEVARALTGGRYVVVPGDSVGRIALQFNTTVGMIVTLNRLTDVNLIQVGQSLLIHPSQDPSPPSAPSANEEPWAAAPPPPPPPQAPQSALAPLASEAAAAAGQAREGPALQSWGHKVQPGDTLTLIAELYNSSVTEIEAMNAKLLSEGPDVLQAGSTVMVPWHDGRVFPASMSRSAANPPLPIGRGGDKRGRNQEGGREGAGRGGGGGEGSLVSTGSRIASGSRYRERGAGDKRVGVKSGGGGSKSSNRSDTLIKGSMGAAGVPTSLPPAPAAGGVCVSESIESGGGQRCGSEDVEDWGGSRTCQTSGQPARLQMRLRAVVSNAALTLPACISFS